MKKQKRDYPVGQSLNTSRQRLTLPQKEYAVPSALEDLTSVFGMGTGVTPPPLSPGSFSLFIFQKPSNKIPSKLPQCITYLSFLSSQTLPTFAYFFLAWSSPRLISIS